MNDHHPTLVELNASAVPRNVFCTHTVGGGLGGYKMLAARLEDAAKVYGLEDPSIYADESFASVPELAALHVETIQQIQPHGPYLLFGTCSGGPLAYEIACQLAMQGEVVERVVMFGSHDQGGFDPAHTDRHRFLVEYLFENYGMRLSDLDWDGFETMDRGSVCAIVTDQIVARNKKHRLPDPIWIRKYLESLCMTRAATSRYRAPKSALNIDLYRQPRGERPADAHREWCDWDDLTYGTLTVIPHAPALRPGDDILADPHLEAIVASLRQNALVGVSRVADIQEKT
ncbi:thioesterase domain-containing protein [Rhodanobacter sp. MP1X3]|uniref:thioesterase domain-containing protein n=1 Tax=Rhodanobacter sp. MP1X3 TaxID=2723086 RepID=UPI0016170B79|nr:thioesterase domain-containing protein [Rhodanobacter sp. MP1X3]MBB6244695.1 thioesterase domain-containing protein [Rhodanobacter sp. MP1X3]